MSEIINADKEFQDLLNASPELVEHGLKGIPFADIIVENIQNGTLKLVDGRFTK
jgi:hypothetical protein